MKWRVPYCNNGGKKRRGRRKIKEGGRRNTQLSNREAKHCNLFWHNRLKRLQWGEYSVWRFFFPPHLSWGAWMLWPEWGRDGMQQSLPNHTLKFVASWIIFGCMNCICGGGKGGNWNCCLVLSFSDDILCTKNGILIMWLWTIALKSEQPYTLRKAMRCAQCTISWIKQTG